MRSTILPFGAGLAIGTIALLAASGEIGASTPPPTEAKYESPAERARMPEGKAAAIAAEEAQNPSQVPLGNPVDERWIDFADSGASRVVEAVRSAVPALESRRAEAFVMPPVSGRASAAAIADDVALRGSVTAADRRRAEAVGKTDPRRGQLLGRARQELEAVHDSASTSDLESEVSAVGLAYDDPTYPGYSGSRFVVDRWIGIEVSGRTARTLLEAHQEYDRYQTGEADSVASVVADPVRRWQVTLSRDSGSWRIVGQSQFQVHSS